MSEECENMLAEQAKEHLAHIERLNHTAKRCLVICACVAAVLLIFALFVWIVL